MLCDPTDGNYNSRDTAFKQLLCNYKGDVKNVGIEIAGLENTRHDVH